MKKILLTLLFGLMGLVANAQLYKMYKTQNYHNQLRLNTANGSVQQIQDDGQKWIIVPEIVRGGKAQNRFQLFETRNMWTFILLDTFNGRLWQVQFSVEGVEYMMYVPINNTPLIKSIGKSIFTIQPMTSIYQYYLINEKNGDMWMFQWATEGDEYRWIKKL